MATFLLSSNDAPHLSSKQIVETNRYVLRFGHRVAHRRPAPSRVWVRAQKLDLGCPLLDGDDLSNALRSVLVDLPEAVLLSTKPPPVQSAFVASVERFERNRSCTNCERKTSHRMKN